MGVLQYWQVGAVRVPTRVRETAPAKINLGLKVMRRRDDGYHDVLSVVQTIDLCDHLVFDRLDEDVIRLTCSDPALPTGPENLVVKAATALRDRLGGGCGVHIHLEKEIPSEGGLGGGSSDAAATLRGLNRLWGANAGDDLLLETAASIGSDVPFLLKPGTAVVSGRGERLQYVEMTGPLVYVLVLPEARVSTPRAFQNVKIGLTKRSPYISLLSSLRGSERLDSDRLLGCLENDFLPMVVDENPEIAGCMMALRRTLPIAVSLSGTGSTLYGVYADISSGTTAAAALRDAGFKAAICRPLSALPDF